MRFLAADNFFFYFPRLHFILHSSPLYLMAWKKLKSKGEGGGGEITASPLLQFSSRPVQRRTKTGVRFRRKYTADVVTRLSSQCKRGPHFRFAPRLNGERESNLPSSPRRVNSTRGTARPEKFHASMRGFIHGRVVVVQRNRSFLNSRTLSLSPTRSFARQN